MPIRVLCVLLLWLGSGNAGAVAADCIKRLCRQMDSCQEAYDVMTACGRIQLDGDRDGVPCEALCGNGIAAEERFAVPEPGGFVCTVRKTCNQTASCDEARFQLEVCGNRRLDRDGDGTPCESICR